MAAGEVSAASTDAINGSQLFNTNTQLSELAASAGSQNQNIASALGSGARFNSATGTWTLPSFATTTINAAGNLGTTLTSTNVGDAVSNLDSSLSNIAAVGVKYDDANSKTRVSFNPGGASTTLANITAGALSADSSDAVNGSQLFATNTSVGNLGAQLNQLANSAGNQFSQLGQGLVNSLGGGAQIDPSTGAVIAPSYRTTAFDSTGTASAAPITSSNVGDALASLNSSLTNVAAVGVKYDDVNSKTRVTFNPGGSSTTLANVANATLSADSTEAVNGSQLFATNSTLSGLSTQLNNINSGAGIKYFHAHSTKADSLASAPNAMALGPNAQASGRSAIALGNDAGASGSSSLALGDGANASADGSVALGKGASDDQRGAETYEGKYSGAANTTAGVVSIGNAATGETRVLSNVADGRKATDAVNLRQLDGAVAESKAYTDSSLNRVQGSLNNTDTAVANVKRNVTRIESDLDRVQKGTSGAFQVNNTRNAQQPKASGTDAVAGGMGSHASGSNSMALGSNAQASAQNATATGTGAQATASNSVALGANSVADRENSVSVGAAGSERQVTNVAAGSRGTDAVNVEQLSRSVANATGRANAHMDQRFAAIRREIAQQDSTLSAGIAGAMAMASLPRSADAGSSMTSMAMGSFRGQSALAIGVSHVSENGRWSTNLMGSTSTQNDTGVAVGVGYQW